MALPLLLPVEESPNPIFESPANRFLVSQQGCDLPIREPFTTLANDELRPHSMLSSFDSRVNDRVVRYRSLAFRACDLVLHFLSFLFVAQPAVCFNFLLRFYSDMVFSVSQSSALKDARMLSTSSWYRSSSGVVMCFQSGKGFNDDLMRIL